MKDVAIAVFGVALTLIVPPGDKPNVTPQLVDWRSRSELNVHWDNLPPWTR